MSEPSLGINSEVNPQQHTPEFDGGSFTIEYLSTSPQGYEIKTDKTSRRREAGSPIPLDSEQLKQLRIAMAGQIKFAEGDKAKTSLDNLRNAQTDEERKITKDKFEKRRLIYKERAVPTIGLRNMRRNGNTITVDIKPVDFPTYREFGKLRASDELLDFASASSTSMILVTRDNRLILQHRSTKNNMYGDVPGASAAGYLRGNFDAAKNGTFIPIDTEYVRNDTAREAKEELGLDEEDFTSLSIVGVSHEKTRILDEFILFAQTKLTAREMKEKAAKASENSKLSTEEFYEKFVDIPANPDAIRILLTEIKCPIPPTHAASFVAAGYYMTLEQLGYQEAQEWKNKLQDAVRKNYNEIDKMVEEYYLYNPDMLSYIPERHKGLSPRKRNPKGYDPEFLPEEQGLPDLISELKRVGLIVNSDGL